MTCDQRNENVILNSLTTNIGHIIVRQRYIILKKL
jgi:hypothetical protein